MMTQYMHEPLIYLSSEFALTSPREERRAWNRIGRAFQTAGNDPDLPALMGGCHKFHSISLPSFEKRDLFLTLVTNKRHGDGILHFTIKDVPEISFPIFTETCHCFGWAETVFTPPMALLARPKQCRMSLR